MGHSRAERIGVLHHRDAWGGSSPGQGVYIPIAAIAVGFVLFWFVLADLVANGARSVAIDWIVLGDTRISWAVIVDRLSVRCSAWSPLSRSLVQVYSIGT